MNKVVILGGGTGLSSLLKSLKNYPLDLTAVVAIWDDGSSTGRLREEFNIPAVGDIRRVITSLSETEPLFEKIMNHRFKSTSDLDGHTLGNLFLTAMIQETKNLTEGIKSLSKMFNLKGKILPLSEDNVILKALMTDNTEVIGEHNITNSEKIIQKVMYQKKANISSEVLIAIEESDVILFSMGSIYTSVIPNIISEEVKNAIDNSKAKIGYICNLMTQPGETDKFTASDHLNAINSYLKNKKIDVMIANSGDIKPNICEKYSTLEQKDAVILDKENITIEIIEENLVAIEDNVLRHDNQKLGTCIYDYICHLQQK